METTSCVDCRVERMVVGAVSRAVVILVVSVTVVVCVDSTVEQSILYLPVEIQRLATNIVIILRFEFFSDWPKYIYYITKTC